MHPCVTQSVIHKPYSRVASAPAGRRSRQPIAGERGKRRRWRRQRGSTMVNKNMSCGKYANNLWPVGRTRPRGRDGRRRQGRERIHGALFSSTHSLRPRRPAAEMVATRIAPKIQNTLHRRAALRNNNKTRASTPPTFPSTPLRPPSRAGTSNPFTRSSPPHSNIPKSSNLKNKKKQNSL